MRVQPVGGEGSFYHHSCAAFGPVTLGLTGDQSIVDSSLPRKLPCTLGEKSAQSAITMQGKQTKEELVQHLKTIAGIYCENDFLIAESSVDGLVLKYQQMNFASAKVKACSDYLVTCLRCEDNGYKSLQTIKDKLVEVAGSKARHIVSKVANVNEVKKFLTFWTKSFDTMIVILETALELLNLSKPVSKT